MSQHCERWRRDAYKAGFSQKPASLLPLRCCGKCFANETYRRIAFFELGQNVASLIKETSHETCWEKKQKAGDPFIGRGFVIQETLDSLDSYYMRKPSKV